MDAHAERVTQHFRAACARYLAGEGTLMELSRASEQAAGALDSANAPLLALLKAASGELEYAYLANARENHMIEARKILEPIMKELNRV